MAKPDLMTEIDKVRVGRRLSYVRRIANVTQDEFAIRAGINRTSYNQYENGAKLPSVMAATLLCIAYDVDLNYIFHGDFSGLRGRLSHAILALMESDNETKQE
jgi:transcriptional regulator with XRE-family HTH domain